MHEATAFTAPYNNPFIRFLTDRRYRWLRHLLFILLGLVLAFKGDIGDASQMHSPQARTALLWVDGVTFLFIMAMLYTMQWVLIPRLLFRSRLFLFSVSFFIMIVLIYMAVWLMDHYFLKPWPQADLAMQHIELSVLSFIQIGAVTAVLLGAVAGLIVFKKWINDVRRMNELRALQLKTELEQLKSQINPHFLFNTLNNLHVLTKIDADKAAQVILGLSDLLRYQLYDSAREKILLSKDIDFINNLLSLEKLRKEDFEYEVHTEGVYSGLSLPPFLFIPFVENAIKHGLSATGHSYVKLSFRVTGQQLYFCCENSKPATRKSLSGGIGLKNIQRRLELLYPDNHTLEIIENEATYIATLILPL